MTDISDPAAAAATSEADAALVERARAGDGDAFGTLYERHAQGIHDFLARLLRDRATAEDCTQATFLRAYEHLDDLRDPSLFRAWLYGTARNLARNHVNRSRPAFPLDDDYVLVAEAGRSADEVAASNERARLVWQAARSLEPRQYAVLDLTLRHDLTPAEVATAMDTSPNHAYVLIHRAREAFGNAVRVLVAARTSGECPRLAQLMPQNGGGPLTPEQRRTVDRHMRRCAACQARARRLTAPVELLGGLVLLPLPAHLRSRDALTRRTSMRMPSSRAWRPRRLLARPPLAVAAVAGIAALGGGVAGTVALTHRAPVAPVVAAPAGGHIGAPASPAATAVPTASATPAPVDESTRTADQAWADALTATRRLRSYHATYTTSSLSDDVIAFDLHVAPGGAYTGTLTLAMASQSPLTVRKAGGILYVQDPRITGEPDLLGLTADQAQALGGTGWLAMTGSMQRNLATIIDRAVGPFVDPLRLADEQLVPEGAVHLDGTEGVPPDELVLISDETGTLAVQRFGAYPVRAHTDLDTLTLGDFDVPVTVAAPASAMTLP